MFTLKFDTDNAAFDDDFEGECGRILQGISQSMADGLSDGIVVDVNGNSIGSWSVDFPD